MIEPVVSDAERDFLDREYNPRTQIPQFAGFFARWKSAALAARQTLPGRFDVPYGPAAAEALDFFPAPGAARPLLVFLHGGYWRALHKDDFSWIAPPYVAAGISVAVVNYGLAPSTPVARIVEQVRRACLWLSQHAGELEVDAGRIICTGHSAGGHLTGMMLATPWQAIAPHAPARLLSGAVTISGVFDLEPLTRAAFLRQDLQLDAQAARELSPAFLPCHNYAPVLRAVGALESAEFHRQSALIAERWPHVGERAIMDVPECNHLSVCDAFAAPGSELFQATCAMLK